MTFGFRTLERWLARATTSLVAVSPEVRDDLVALRVAPASKFTVVRLGIDLAHRIASDDDQRRETRRQMGLRDDEFVVGWVGRMTAVKNTDRVVRALQTLVDLGVDARLLLVGDGPDRDHLERYAHELGVMKRCLFLGYQEDVARFYDAIDALVLSAGRDDFNHQVGSAHHALAGGNFFAPLVADEDDVRNDAAVFAEDDARSHHDKAKRVCSEKLMKVCGDVSDNDLVREAGCARHE